MKTAAWLIIGFPLLGCVVTGAGYRVWKGRTAGYLATLAIAASFVASVITFFGLQDRAEDARQVTSSLWDYAITSGVDAKLGILIDPLAVMMALIVSGVSMLIHLYSVSYMTGDRGSSRFFAYLNFFVFSMLVLVLAGNFLLLIVGWAFVGAASYLLISFWYRRTTATRAGIKAFVINVVGDVGLVLGTFFILRHSGTLDFVATFKQAPLLGTHEGSLTAGLILLLVGAFAKSAQVPLHTWLPDAMEGPTPVSALIHAATMVTAGVYLIARMHPLFEQAPGAAAVGAVVGCATLLIAATIAIVQTDLKRVIAYSTMSQIGYMVMGVSTGAYAAGMFHLMTHAFFKALLFMAAGSIISAMAGEQSLDRMGGFRKAMPFTFFCFIFGGLALSGVPPFSGWLSKDEILAFQASLGGWHDILWVAGYVGALLTAAYTFRMILRAFMGPPVPEARELEQGHLHHAETPFNPGTGEEEDTDVGFPGPEHAIAEREGPMKVAMGVLAVLALGAGVVQIPGVDSGITKFLAPTFAGSKFADVEPSQTAAWLGLALGAVIGVIGIFVAATIWLRRRGSSAALQARLPALHRFLANKWYFDELLDGLVVRPASAFGRFAQGTFERTFVDGTLIGGTTGLVRAGSAAVRALQTGFLRYYAALLLLGITATGLYFLIRAA